MIIRKILYYGKAYVLNFPIAMFHEFCHFVPGVIFYCLGIMPKCPRIRVTQWYYIRQTSYGATESQSIKTHVTTWTYAGERTGKICNHIVEIMPMFGTIVLFLISPWYLWIWYLCEIETLFLSLSDMQDLQGKRGERDKEPEIPLDQYSRADIYDRY